MFKNKNGFDKVKFFSYDWMMKKKEKRKTRMLSKVAEDIERVNFEERKLYVYRF